MMVFEGFESSSVQPKYSVADPEAKSAQERQ